MKWSGYEVKFWQNLEKKRNTDHDFPPLHNKLWGRKIMKNIFKTFSFVLLKTAYGFIGLEHFWKLMITRL